MLEYNKTSTYAFMLQHIYAKMIAEYPCMLLCFDACMLLCFGILMFKTTERSKWKEQAPERYRTQKTPDTWGGLAAV
jgi:hypothetical protein